MPGRGEARWDEAHRMILVVDESRRAGDIDLVRIDRFRVAR